MVVMVLAKLERFRIANVKLPRNGIVIEDDAEPLEEVTPLWIGSDSDTGSWSSLSQEELDEHGNGLGYQLMGSFTIPMLPRPS